MMIALVLALAQEVEPVPAPAPSTACPWELTLRTGLWRMDDFRATLPAGSREFTREILLDVGLDLRWSFDGWFAALSGDYATSSALEATAASLRGGYGWDVACLFDRPFRLSLSAGIVAATLEVDESRFGDFDAGLGGAGRIDLELSPAPSLRAGLWSELRVVKFEFEPATVAGDDEAGGATVALGMSISLGF